MYKDKEIIICIPTLVRYDCLIRAIESAEKGTLVPDKYLVIDNGGNLSYTHPKMIVYKPSRNIGVAASWNYFIRHAKGYRIIINDDIIFYPETIEKFISNLEEDKFCSPSNIIEKNSFSCFYLPDAVVDRVGYFDEAISPGWGYYEDNDYYRRMKLIGIDMVSIPSEVDHVGSATLKALKGPEEKAHHQRFEIAKANYLRKWGGLPAQETFSTPYNRG